MSALPAASGEHPLMSDAHYAALKSQIIALTGLEYYQQKDLDLCEKVSRRMIACNIRHCVEYVELLQNQNRVELDALVEELTIGETYFFRHNEQFDAFRQHIIPAVMEKNRATRKLTVWCAGCSTGAEPYTVSIILKREFARELKNWNVKIIGTDINQEFLARARQGIFENWSLRSITSEIRSECFSQQGRQWHILKPFMEGVSFATQNLISDPFPKGDGGAPLDVIFCRNVMIYFKQDVIDALMPKFYAALADDAWLVIGYSEFSAEIHRYFSTLSLPGAIVHRKRGSADKGNYEPWKPHEFESLLRPEAAPAAEAEAELDDDVAKHRSSLINFPTLPSDWGHKHQSFVNSSVSKAQPATSMRNVAVLIKAGKLGEAREICEVAVKSDGLNPAVHFYLGFILADIESDDKAEECFRKAIYLDRKFVLAHYHLGLLHQKHGDRDKALRCFKSTLRLLAHLPEDKVFVEGDGVTVGELLVALAPFAGGKL